MSSFLNKVFSEGGFIDEGGEFIHFHSESSLELCGFLQKLIHQHKCSRSIEIGFAYGLSTVAILEAIVAEGGKHLVIDKFENTHWKGHGLQLIRSAGFNDFLEFHEQYCYEALPLILSTGRRFDFAYVDSTKQFDWLLVNFFYLDKILDIGGVLVFDDVNCPAIRKLLRMIVSFPSYKVIDKFPMNFPVSRLQKFAGILSRLPLSNKLFKPELAYPDKDLGIIARAVAIQKISDDNRNWNWFRDF